MQTGGLQRGKSAGKVCFKLSRLSEKAWAPAEECGKVCEGGHLLVYLKKSRAGVSCC